MIGRRNVYTCQACAGQIVTVDRAEGVTPYMLACRATDGCSGMMQSAFYRVEGRLVPTHEWYAPDAAELARLDLAMREHVERGGLLIRPVEPAP